MPDSSSQCWEGMWLENVIRCTAVALMSMGCHVLYSEADHTNSRLVLDISAHRVLRIRGGKLGYRCILLLLPDEIWCQVLRERGKERVVDIFQSINGGSSHNALLVISG